ncbi:MAG TPA: PEP/pyruvate-binding domain-containing protein, partial [Candidatus Dojkabacteria bacterium]|nr:PEP/pyruvate-binding domain-containing protein [Candidatus Dojkabacteria bacterium]
MLGKKKQYVITITQTSDEVNELVGKLALELNQMQQLGVSILSGFVVTSTAFDDFLVANDLVSFIAPRINDLNYNDEFTVKKASEEIRQIIASSVVPDMVKNPILKAYAGLSGFIESFVSVQASPIDSKLDEKKYHKPLMLTNIKGADLLMDSLKQSWAEFFSEAALAYRAGIGYEGYLTEALIIQKMPHAELSGKILTVNSHDHDPEVLEVQAIWGLDENLVGKEITPDSYFYDKKSEAVKEKKIVGQDWMLVRRGRGDSSKPTVRVNISKSLQKKQKLDDKNILGLARVGAVIENYYQKPQEISWIYEAGKTYVTQSRELELDKEPSPVISKDFSAKLQELDAEMAQKKGKQGKTMEGYVAEVQNYQGNSQQSQPALKPLQPQEKPSEVEVVVEPLSKLSSLFSGKGKGKEPVFGLVHHVLKAQDYENLTGDEILVMPELLPDYLDKEKAAKGLIVEKDVGSELLEKVQIPLIYNLNKSAESIEENMVVTLDPESALVLSGAGKKVSQDTLKNLPETAEKAPDATKPGKEPESNIVF